jgi:phosphotriesterase-related protein
VDSSQVVLGHLGRNPDQGHQREVASSGAFLCFDGPSRANHHTDWRTIESNQQLAAEGHLDQLLIGGDTTTAAARSVNQGPGMPGLITGLATRICGALGADAIEAIMVRNPARAFAFAPVDQSSPRSIPRSSTGAEWVSAPTAR